jgi:PAS domain S-box-containing protein
MLKKWREVLLNYTSLSLATALTALVLLGGLGWWNTTRLMADANAVAHSHEVIITIDDLGNNLRDAHLAHNNYLNTGAPGDYTAFIKADGDLKDSFHALRILNDDSPNYKLYRDVLGILLDQQQILWMQTAHNRIALGQASAQAIANNPRLNRLPLLYQILDTFLNNQVAVLQVRNGSSEIAPYRSQIIFSISIMLISAVMLVILGTVRRETRSRAEIHSSLEKSERRFREQYQAMPIPTYTWRVEQDDFALIDYNTAAERFTQGQIKYYLGSKAREFYTHAPEIVTMFKRCLEEKTTLESEVTYQMRTTSLIKDLIVTCVYIAPDQVMVHTVDITERKLIEASLTESRRFAERVTEASPSVIYIYNFERREFVYRNRDLGVILGYPEQQITTLNDALDIIHPIDVPRLRTHIDEMEASREDVISEIEFRIRDAKQEWRWQSSHDIPFRRDANGKVIEYMGTLQDSTERHKMLTTLSRERNLLRIVINHVPDYIFVKDRTGHYILGNLAFSRSVNLPTPEDMIGKTSAQIMESNFAAELEADDQRVLERGISLLNVERQQIDPSGQPRWNLITKVPLRDQHGQIVGLVGISRDITDQRQSERELAESRDNAVEAARLQSTFLATMSHEIRTPINGVIGMIDILAGTTLDSKQREMVTIIHNSGQSLLALINDILDFSKIEAGMLTLEDIEFEPLEIVENVADVLTPQARQKHLTLLTYVDPMIPPLLRGDTVRLHQVLLNLGNNAIKFTAQGEVVIRAHLEFATLTQATIKFSVRDTGIGLAPSDRDRLFKPFVQADASTTRRFGGTGLGLAICRRLVDMMNGELDFDSEVGQGATFWIRLTLPIADPKIVPESTRLTGVKILVADENVTSGEILSQYLGMWGATYGAVTTSAEALTVLRSASSTGEPYGITLVSATLPDLDGLALGQTIRQDKPLSGTHLILISNVYGEDQLQRVADTGFSGYLTKPIRQPQLLNLLIGLLKTESHVNAEQRIPVTPHNAAATDQVILVVEDNEVNQMVVSHQLEALGYASVTVSSGADAIQALHDITFNAVLMDCQMPEMDGYETTQRIRDQEKTSQQHIPIIAMTANAMASDRERCLAAGMDDYLSKPMTIRQLQNVLSHWVGGQSTVSSDTGPLVVLPENQAVVINTKVLEELRGMVSKSGPAVFHKLIETFVTNSDKLLIDLRQTFEHEDYVAFQRTAHTFKSSAGHYGAEGLAKLCRDLEMACREGPIEATRAHSFIQEIDTEYNRVKVALLSYAG